MLQIRCRYLPTLLIQLSSSIEDLSIACSSTARNGLAVNTAFCHLVERLSVQLYCYNARMILHFWALHPHLEDDWLRACADWDADCLIDPHGNDDTLNTPSDEADELPSLGCRPAMLPSSRESMVDTIDTVDVLDSLGQRDGDCVDEESFRRCHLAVPPTSRKSVANDDVDDLCYTVDVCNRFSLLTVETTSAEESGVEDFPTELGCVPIMKATKSKGGPKKSVSSEDWGSPSSTDQVATVHVVEKRQVETEGHITHYSQGSVATSGHI